MFVGVSPLFPYGECHNTICPTLSVCMPSAGMGLLRIALGRCLHPALFGAQGQCNPIIFLPEELARKGKRTHQLTRYSNSAHAKRGEEKSSR